MAGWTCPPPTDTPACSEFSPCLFNSAPKPRWNHADLHPPPVPACTAANPRNKKKMFRCLGGLVPSSSTTPQLRCLAAKWRCNRTGRRKKAPSSSRSLIAAITTFASRTLHKMMKRKRNAFELTEPLQDVWGNCKSPKLAFNIYFFSSPRFNLPSRVNPCNLQWHLLMFSRPQCV